jgi:hypothetical protein
MREVKDAHTHTAYVPSGTPTSRSSSRITFSFRCDSNAATKLNDDPLMASRRWPMRPILYSSTCQYTLVREGRRREGTHRHMHAHVERSSETNPSTPHPHELVRRGRGGETLFAEIGPPPTCVDNSFEGRRFLMTLSKASPRPCPSSAPAEGAADPGSISRRRNCSRKLKSSLFAVLFLFHSHIIPPNLHIIPPKTNYTPKPVSPKKKKHCGSPKLYLLRPHNW